MAQKIKILIVEDEALAVMGMQDIFELWGYEVCKPAASGEEALERNRTEKPDIIIVDIHLVGEMDGITLAHQIRLASNAPIFFVTGHSHYECETRASKVENSTYLTKPLNFDSFQEMLAAAIRV